MTIPWDTPHYADDPASIPPNRPPWLPAVGEPVDPETAARIMAWYGPEIAATLDRIAGVVRQRHNDAAVTVRAWTVDEIAALWSAESDGILMAFVTLDDRDRGKSFRSVLVLIDKASGAVIVRDATGLLGD